MKEKNIDSLILFPSPNMRYLTGFDEETGERLLTVIILQSGEPLFIVPKLYEKHVKASTWAKDIRVWKDSEDPRIILKRVIRDLSLARARIAMDSRLWARFFLMFLHAAPRATYLDASEVMAPLEFIKSQEETGLLKESSKLADSSMEAIIEHCVVGATEREIANSIEYQLRILGAEGLSLKPIVASGPNAAYPHYRSGGRRLGRRDPVVLDFGGTSSGYHSDITRTVFVKRCRAKMREAYEAIREAQQLAFEAIQCGTEAQHVDRIARGHLQKLGYGKYFIHRTGHGIGLEGHEEPYIVEGSSRALENGMAFTIEPGVYIPNEFGVRIEDLVVIEGSRALRLNSFRRDLILT